jgi:hypothetical protein
LNSAIRRALNRKRESKNKKWSELERGAREKDVKQGFVKQELVIMQIQSQLFPVHTMIDQKQVDNVEYLKYLGTLKTNVPVLLNPGFVWQRQLSKRVSFFSPAHWTLICDENYDMLHLEQSFEWS